MGVGRIAGPVAIALWLGMTAALAAPSGIAAADGEPLTAAIASDRMELSTAPNDSIDRVGGGAFVAMPWQPGALGDPDTVIDRVMAEAVDRAHRRITGSDLSGEAGDDNATLTDLDSGWDGWGALMPEHRLRRLRQIANLIPDRASADERVIELDPRYAGDAPRSGAGDDSELLRYLKEAFKGIQNGTFFTRERIALLLAGLLAVGLLSRATALRGK